MSNENWTKTSEQMPSEGRLVFTKIDDGRHERNLAALMLRGRMWYVSDESMYVYYAPTHWRELTEREKHTIADTDFAKAGIVWREARERHDKIIEQ